AAGWGGARGRTFSAARQRVSSAGDRGRGTTMGRQTAFIQALSGVPPSAPRRKGSTTAQRAELLSRVPLFSGLSRRHLRKLAEACTDARYRPGTTIVVEGRPGDTFFVIVEGQAAVLRGVRRAARLGPGDFFGEIALL